jgi:type III secretory pathway component EscU
MEGYVDDMLVKSMTFKQHLRDLREVFQVLKNHNIKLNSSKCVFAILRGKFLGFLVSHRAIEPNLEKIQVLLGMNPLKTVKEVKRLIGRLAALSRFIAKLGELSLLFFKILRNVPNFQWTPECQKSFDELKIYLSFPNILS